MKRTKVLFVHQVGCRGGAGTMLANVLAALDKQRFEPIVVCPPGDVVQQLAEAGAEVRIAPRPLYQFSHYTGYSKCALHPSFLAPVLRMWRDQRFWESYFRVSGADIVCLNAMTLAPMAFAARRAGTKVVCFVQETAVHGLLGLRTAWLYGVLSRKADAVVFISKHDRDRARCSSPIVEVVPNWVDLSLFHRGHGRESARAELSIPPDREVLLMMGGVSELKGTLTLLEAAGQLPHRNQLMIVVAGYSEAPSIDSLSTLHRWTRRMRMALGRDYGQRVRRAMVTGGLSGRVIFTGMQSNVVHLYAAADVLVFPSTRPHQARPVLEAGALAKPVVISDFPQTSEFVVNGFNGLTFEPGDCGSLARALESLLANKPLAKELGNNNLQVTRKFHNSSLNAPLIGEILTRVASGR